MNDEIKQTIFLVRNAFPPVQSSKISCVVDQDKAGRHLLRFPPYNSTRYPLESIVETALQYSKKVGTPIMFRLDIPLNNGTLYKIERMVGTETPPSPGSLEQNTQDWTSLIKTVAQEIRVAMTAAKNRLQEENQKRILESRLPECVLTARHTLREMGREDVAEALIKFTGKLIQEQKNFSHLKHNLYLKSELCELSERLTNIPHIIFFEHNHVCGITSGELPKTDDPKVHVTSGTTRSLSTNRYNAPINALKEKWFEVSKISYDESSRNILNLHMLFNAIFEAHDSHALKGSAEVLKFPEPKTEP